jgi:hypothetical protein
MVHMTVTPVTNARPCLYAGRGTVHDFDLVLFSIESYGRLGGPAMRFLRTLAEVASASGRVSKRAAMEASQRLVSVTLCKGVAALQCASVQGLAQSSDARSDVARRCAWRMRRDVLSWSCAGRRVPCARWCQRGLCALCVVAWGLCSAAFPRAILRSVALCCLVGCSAAL